MRAASTKSAAAARKGFVNVVPPRVLRDEEGTHSLGLRNPGNSLLEFQRLAAPSRRMGAILTTMQTGADLPNTRAKVLKSDVLYEGKVFQLRRDTVIEPGGVQAERDIIVHPGSVVVLPIFENGRVLLIRQYRHSVGEFLWELVAGRKEPNENPPAAARRELLEETGYSAKRLRKLMRVVPTPGFVNEWMWIFAAEGLTEGAAQPEEDEKITPRIFTLKQAEQMIERGTLRDAKSICGILYYLRFVKRRR
jgi:ADP-ribose pyrophosphatase